MYTANAMAYSEERKSYFEYGTTELGYYLLEYRPSSIRNYAKARHYEDFAHLASLNGDILNNLEWSAAEH